MINGDATDFIDGLHYGDERFFYYGHCKYFIQGYLVDSKPMLILYILEPADNDFKWSAISENKYYPVSDFEKAPIFNGRTFWQVEKEIEWVDS